MMMIWNLLSTLLPTILIELVVLWLLGETRRKVLWSSVVVNTLTNVPLNLWLSETPRAPLFRGEEGWMLAVAIGEVLVVIVETIWYWWFVREVKRAVVYSVLCNAISFLTGVLFQLLCWMI
ncbi:MAG: hypothetical protein IKT00_00410 [Prevotella sp.]|nr:hypothetical protein [Prevotella sp.]